MLPRRISNLAVALLAVACLAPARSQVVVPAAAPSPSTKADQAPVTLGDLARVAREVEVEKHRRALREAKNEPAPTAAGGVAPAVERARAKKPVPKPVTPEGLFVRAIFGVAPKTYVRFFTKNNEFEDKLVGETVQGWKVVRIRDGIVTLEQGAVTYPMALQMRTAASIEHAPAAPSTAPMISGGLLPDPRVGQ